MDIQAGRFIPTRVGNTAVLSPDEISIAGLSPLAWGTRNV